MGGPTTDDDRRMQLIHRIEYLESELTRARSELAALCETAVSDPTSTRSNAIGQKAQGRPTRQESPEPHDAPARVENAPITHMSPLDAKLELFMSRFCGRADVYARRWESAKTGKRGWSPATRSGFYDPKNVRPEDYEPLTKQLVARHLSGVRNAKPDDTRKPLHIGLYPLRKDDTCRLLACDFDNDDWRSAAAAFSDECTTAGIDALAEISSSGSGAHIWLFFESAVPAAIARRAGMSLLRRAMDKDTSITFSSYDRLFPSQDKLPVNSPGRGSFGNLIALPLQGDMRGQGTTVFAHPQTWEPYNDQFAALDRTRLISPAEVERIAEDSSADPLGPDDTPPAAEVHAVNAKWRMKPRREDIRALQPKVGGAEITLRRDTQLHVPIGDMPSVLLSDLKHLSSLANPEFYRKQAMRMSTFGEPRVVVRFEETDEELRMPRGLFDDVRSRLEMAGYTVRERSSRRKRDRIAALFTGTLRPDQQTAVAEMLSHDMGVLVAPPGTGKTVMACALIAERRVGTAVIVPTRELLLQWGERLRQFLSLDDGEIGQLGGGKRKTTGFVDLIMMRSISHSNADPTLLNRYGQIIVDECHGVAAPAAEAALNQVDAPRWLGLTATPYRADQLNGLITMQCGPVRYDMAKTETGEESHVKPEADQESATPKRTFHVHQTDFTTEEPGAGGPSMPDLYAELATDEGRNSQIIPKIVAEANEGRHVLVLTNRIDHLRTLVEGIRNKVPKKLPVLRLHGQLKPGERARQREKLRDTACSGDSFVLVAIDKVAGEGFDLPVLDSLFLTMPISFKGRVVQNLGRVTRGDLTVDEVTVHDFHDVEVPVLDRMFHKRRRAIKSEGFGI